MIVWRGLLSFGWFMLWAIGFDLWKKAGHPEVAIFLLAMLSALFSLWYVPPDWRNWRKAAIIQDLARTALAFALGWLAGWVPSLIGVLPSAFFFLLGSLMLAMIWTSIADQKTVQRY